MLNRRAWSARLPLHRQKQAVDQVEAAAFNNSRRSAHDVLHGREVPLVGHPPPAADEEFDLVVPSSVGYRLGAEIPAERVEERLFKTESA